MFKAIAAATATVALALGLSLAAVAPASAEGVSNSPSYYQTPGTGEICAKWTPSGDTTTVGVASFSIPAGNILTKVVIKAGNTGASGQGPENHGYYTDATYAYPAAYADLDWTHVSNLSATTFSHPSGKNISHAIYCYVPAPPTDVAGSASATNPVCDDGQIVSGFISVTLTTGVTYVITNSSNTVIGVDGSGHTAALPAGNYTVAVSASSNAYHLTSASSIPLSIGADPEGCGTVKPTDVEGAASATNPVCTENQVVSGFITVTITTGVTYVITNDADGTKTPIPFDGTTGKTGDLPEGSYTVAVSALDSSFHLTSAASIPLTINANPTDCGSVGDEVTPKADATDQTCNKDDLEHQHTVNGFITVSNLTGITYKITADTDASHTAIPYNASGVTGLLVPGDYTVHPTANSGFTLSSTDDIHVTIAKYAGVCQQEVTHPAVDPSATQKQLGCSTDGSYTLTTDQVNPNAVLWTVNGSPVGPGTYVVTGAGSVHVTAVPGPGFGFAGDENHQLLTWDFTFAAPSTCDLKTLALTGTTDGLPMLAASGMLLLLGVALVRSGLRIRRRNAAS